MVERDCRQSGLGKAMLRWAWDEFDAERLEAETDRESVEFYRKCGFQVQSLGSQRGGIERFRCSRDRQEPAVRGSSSCGGIERFRCSKDRPQPGYEAV